MIKNLTTLCLALALASISYASTMTASIYSTARQELLGTVTFVDTPYGLLITPQLTNLFPGPHGFHVHQFAKCSNKGADAGGHYDPAKTDSHQGPYGKGHLGDLPVLIVGANSQANIPTLAPRLKTSDLVGRSIIIHEGSDNYSDTPPLGGGGARFACGVIQSSD
ncbi:MAG: superoxide dismutase [Legionellales bacterium RIFCSPHIGHO2_12_FULL_42_9]|nr:MAG: superoxide dismutase [Legionellales bacterium RIFCSPHIGHO2_12_FULL_42_9]